MESICTVVPRSSPAETHLPQRQTSQQGPGQRGGESAAPELLKEDDKTSHQPRPLDLEVFREETNWGFRAAFLQG